MSEGIDLAGKLLNRMTLVVKHLQGIVMGDFKSRGL